MTWNSLSQCGLNETEQNILLWLVKHGESIASLIAKQTKLKRTTVYTALEALGKRGLVNKFKRSGVTYYASIKADLIPQILEQRAREEYEEVKRAGRVLSEQLMAITPSGTDFGAFKIESYESLEAIYVILENAVNGGDFDSWFNPQIALFPPFINLVRNYLKRTEKTKPHIREILVAGEMADWYSKQIKNPNHHVKILEKNTEIFSDIVLFDGSLIFNHYEVNREACIQIREENLFRTTKTIFELMWSQLP